jgi:TRAP-type uncharacterized transport system substrate-binding protein
METTFKDHPDRPVSSSWREWVGVVLPFVGLGAVLFAVAWIFVEPAPPSHVVIATGPEGASYNDFARQYAEYFAERGITLEIRKTKGSRENYRLLADEGSGIDAAIVQGGTAPPAEETKALEAICAVGLEPLFILYRKPAFGQPVEGIQQLAGKRLAVGRPEGGTYWVVTPLLALSGINGTSATLVEESGQAAVKMLVDGEVDAAFFCVTLDTAYVREAMGAPGIGVANVRRAPAYAGRLDFLKAVTVHEGMVDLSANLPDRDVTTIAPTAALITRKSTHKAIIQLFVQAVQKVHGRPDPLAGPGAFPTLDYTQLPIGSEARYFFGSKPGFLQRKLPFWLASLIDRLLILVIPMLVILIPLVRLAPKLYQWRMRARVMKWYKRLRALDGHLLEPASAAQRAVDRSEAERLEAEILRHTHVPLGYMDSFYQLRTHLAFLRDRLAAAPNDGKGPR